MVPPRNTITKQEFDVWFSHSDPVPIDRNGRFVKEGQVFAWLAQNGDYVVNGDGGWFGAELYPAPTDPIGLYKRELDYARADLAQAEESFHNLKNSLLGTSRLDPNRLRWRSSYGPKPDDDVSRLTALAKAVKARVEALEKLIQNRPSELPPSTDEMIGERQRERQAYLNRIQDINI